MKTYRVKYYILFSFDEKEIKVKGGTSVEDGSEFCYEDDDDNLTDAIVKNDDTASQYIYTLFMDNEDNLVDIPEEYVKASDVGDTELHITNIISIQQ